MNKIKSKKHFTKIFIITTSLVLFLGLLRISIHSACWNFEEKFKIVSFLFPEEKMLLKICDEPTKTIIRLPIEGLIIFLVLLILSIVFIVKTKDKQKSPTL